MVVVNSWAEFYEVAINVFTWEMKLTVDAG
jgi:hypothetical protein